MAGVRQLLVHRAISVHLLVETQCRPFENASKLFFMLFIFLLCICGIGPAPLDSASVWQSVDWSQQPLERSLWHCPGGLPPLGAVCAGAALFGLHGGAL